MEFYDCLKVVWLYPSVVCLWVVICLLFTLITLYILSLRYAQTSYSLPDSQVGFPMLPPLNMSCYPSNIAKILLISAKGFLDWPVMFLDQFWLSFDQDLV